MKCITGGRQSQELKEQGGWVKAFIIKAGRMSLIPRIHVIEEN